MLVKWRGERRCWKQEEAWRRGWRGSERERDARNGAADENEGAGAREFFFVGTEVHVKFIILSLKLLKAIKDVSAEIWHEETPSSSEEQGLEKEEEDHL